MKALRLAIVLVTLCLFTVLAFAKVTSPKDLDNMQVIGMSTYHNNGNVSLYLLVDDGKDLYVVHLNKDKDISEIYEVKDRKKLEETNTPTKENLKLIWSLKGSV